MRAVLRPTLFFQHKSSSKHKARARSDRAGRAARGPSTFTAPALPSVTPFRCPYEGPQCPSSEGGAAGAAGSPPCHCPSQGCAHSRLEAAHPFLAKVEATHPFLAKVETTHPFLAKVEAMHPFLDR